MIPLTAGLHFFGGTGGVVFARKGGVVGDVNDGEGAARCLRVVRPGVVEGAAVVESNAAGGHIHGHRLGHIVTLVLHLVDDALAIDAEFDRFEAAVFMRSGHEVQAAVFPCHVVNCDPGRESANRFHGPVRGVLMPVRFLA